MATFTHLDRGYAFSNPLNTASLTADTCALLVMVLDFQGTSAPSVSGCGLTWAQRGTAVSLDADIDAYFFVGTGTMSTGVLTISGGGGGAFTYVVSKITSANISAPILQHSYSSGTGTTPATTLSAFESGSNATFTYSVATGGAYTEGSGFTELYDGLSMFDGGRLQSQYINSNDTTPDCTLSLSADWIFAAFEIDESASGGPASISSATPSGTIGTSTSAVLGCTTDQTTGTIYGVVDTSANLTGATIAEVKAGQRAGGSAALSAANASVSSTSPTVNCGGLSPGTAYAYRIVQNNANGDSNLLSGTFTTAAAIVNRDNRKFGAQGMLRTLINL